MRQNLIDLSTGISFLCVLFDVPLGASLWIRALIITLLLSVVVARLFGTNISTHVRSMGHIRWSRWLGRLFRPNVLITLATPSLLLLGSLWWWRWFAADSPLSGLRQVQFAAVAMIVFFWARRVRIENGAWIHTLAFVAALSLTVYANFAPYSLGLPSADWFPAIAPSAFVPVLFALHLHSRPRPLWRLAVQTGIVTFVLFATRNTTPAWLCAAVAGISFFLEHRPRTITFAILLGIMGLTAAVLSQPGESKVWAVAGVVTNSFAQAQAGLTMVASSGMGIENSALLPEATTDFVYALLIAHGGLASGLLYIALLSAVVCAVLRAGSGGLAPVLALTVALQAMASIGVNVGLLPLGGVALPFLSYGGSYLVADALALGIAAASVRAAPPEQSAFSGRRLILALLFLVITLIVVGRTVQIRHFDDAAVDRAFRRLHKPVLLPSLRGAVVDRSGGPLAIEVPRWRVRVIPGNWSATERPTTPDNFADLIASLRLVLGLGSEFETKGDPFYAPLTLDAAALDAVDWAVAQGLIQPEFWPETHYPLGSTMAATLGFVSREGVHRKGLEGVLLTSDELLAPGEPGITWKWSPGGNWKRWVSDAPQSSAYAEFKASKTVHPVHGEEIRLTVHHDLASRLRGLVDGSPEVVEALLVANSRGEILAIESSPSFDPLRFSSQDPRAYRNRSVFELFDASGIAEDLLSHASGTGTRPLELADLGLGQELNIGLPDARPGGLDLEDEGRTRLLASVGQMLRALARIESGQRHLELSLALPAADPGGVSAPSGGSRSPDAAWSIRSERQVTRTMSAYDELGGEPATRTVILATARRHGAPVLHLGLVTDGDQQVSRRLLDLLGSAALEYVPIDNRR